MADQKANQAAYGADHEETVRLLKEARHEVAEMKLERDQLRSQAKRSGWVASGAAADTSESGEGTINQLMAGPDWLTKKGAPANSNLEAQVAAPQDPPPEDMLAPELVFTKKDKDKDGD